MAHADRPTVAEALTDAALTVLVAGATIGYVAGGDVSLAPAPALVGAVGALLVEVFLGQHHVLVREAWARRPVKAGAVLLGVAAVLVGGQLAPTLALSALLGGLLAYLAVLAGVTAGVLPAPRYWV